MIIDKEQAHFVHWFIHPFRRVFSMLQCTPFRRIVRQRSGRLNYRRTSGIMRKSAPLAEEESSRMEP
jgi:hypothetical protein